MKSGIELITAERENQYQKGRNIVEDVKYNSNEFVFHNPLIKAAHELLYQNPLASRCPDGWDIDRWIKLCNKPIKERFIISAALIAAQLDVMTYNNK